MKRFVIDIEKLVVDGAAITPMMGKSFRRQVERALEQRLESRGRPPQVVAKQSVMISIATADGHRPGNATSLAGQLAQGIYQSLAKKA